MKEWILDWLLTACHRTQQLTLGGFLCHMSCLHFVMQWDVNIPRLYTDPLCIPVDSSSASELSLPPLLLAPALQRKNLPRQNDFLGPKKTIL